MLYSPTLKDQRQAFHEPHAVQLESRQAQCIA